jgi:hypothetical protein
MRGISLLAEEFLTSEEGLCPWSWFNYFSITNTKVNYGCPEMSVRNYSLLAA